MASSRSTSDGSWRGSVADSPRGRAVVIGAGHNGLVSAVLLAREGLEVTVVEASDVVGGACRTETPFARVPGLRHSTGAYLLGLMPPELLALLDLDVRLHRRDPHYFLPTIDGRSVRLGSDQASNEAAMLALFGAQACRADAALQAELEMLRQDLATAWLQEPLTVEQTAEDLVRPTLRETFVELCRGSVADYLARFDFGNDLLVAMYAVTDGLSGLTAGPDTPGSGHNFLVHNMCRLPGSGGTWMIAEGGMGAVTQQLATRAVEAGAKVITSAEVAAILTSAGAVTGVTLADGREIAAEVVVAACDPHRLLALLEPGSLEPGLEDRVRGWESTRGTTMKVNLALRELPRLSAQEPGASSPLGATVHLLPGTEPGGDPMGELRRMWDQVRAGELPDWPTIEWYVHTTVDPTLQDAAGHHSSALFVQSVPYEIAGSSWDAMRDTYADHLLSIVDRFAPGTSDLVADRLTLAPPDIESRFGITGGHIHHVDNAVSFTDRMPCATGVAGLYAGSAGCHPGGSVIGAAGHNAARRAIAELH